MWWALSGPVGALALRCATKPREITASLEDLRREVSGEIPGPPDAAASALLQATSCDPAAFVVAEAASTWLSGPNRVLAKTLDSARGALRAAALHARGGLFDGLARERLSMIDDALRTAPLRDILSSPAGRARIVAHERRQAAKARAPLYRLTWDCASALLRIEALERESLAALLASDVLPRLETWRRFEMACLLEIAEALSAAAGVPCALDASFVAGRPAACVGDINVWWQRAIRSRPDEELDEGERMAANLAESLGIAAGTARADLTIERQGRILAIVECKWFGSSSSVPSAILEACNQLTGYARDAAFRQGDNSAAILSRSLIALADRDDVPLTVGIGPVGCVGLSDLGGTALGPWAMSVLAVA
ncbi:hypothetical protein [Burkholderia sp. ABCPW 111]|uniref:hypothetical protein n=1 Tax=Burkholderia sp. ABCPW 111 TaxID=1820025 RepID=UPI00190FBE67|nr:hypothetical protein [Burkholderia sp. ABCPW 111]